jgi:hypothetical protein
LGLCFCWFFWSTKICKSVVHVGRVCSFRIMYTEYTEFLDERCCIVRHFIASCLCMGSVILSVMVRRILTSSDNYVHDVNIAQIADSSRMPDRVDLMDSISFYCILDFNLFCVWRTFLRFWYSGATISTVSRARITLTSRS